MMLARTFVAGMFLLVPATGCSVSVGDLTVDSDKLEDEVADRLEEQVGQRPESVDCPSDLEGALDAEVRCTLTTQDGQEYGVTVTVASVEGENVNFDIQVDDQPQ